MTNSTSSVVSQPAEVKDVSLLSNLSGSTRSRSSHSLLLYECSGTRSPSLNTLLKSREKLKEQVTKISRDQGEYDGKRCLRQHGSGRRHDSSKTRDRHHSDTLMRSEVRRGEISTCDRRRCSDRVRRQSKDPLTRTSQGRLRTDGRHSQDFTESHIRGRRPSYLPVRSEKKAFSSKSQNKVSSVAFPRRHNSRHATSRSRSPLSRSRRKSYYDQHRGDGRKELVQASYRELMARLPENISNILLNGSSKLSQCDLELQWKEARRITSRMSEKERRNFLLVYRQLCQVYQSAINIKNDRSSGVVPLITPPHSPKSRFRRHEMRSSRDRDLYHCRGSFNTESNYRSGRFSHTTPASFSRQHSHSRTAYDKAENKESEKEERRFRHEPSSRQRASRLPFRCLANNSQAYNRAEKHCMKFTDRSYNHELGRVTVHNFEVTRRRSATSHSNNHRHRDNQSSSERLSSNRPIVQDYAYGSRCSRSRCTKISKLSRDRSRPRTQRCETASHSGVRSQVTACFDRRLSVSPNSMTHSLNRWSSSPSAIHNNNNNNNRRTGKCSGPEHVLRGPQTPPSSDDEV